MTILNVHNSRQSIELNKKYLFIYIFKGGTSLLEVKDNELVGVKYISAIASLEPEITYRLIALRLSNLCYTIDYKNNNKIIPHPYKTIETTPEGHTIDIYLYEE